MHNYIIQCSTTIKMVYKTSQKFVKSANLIATSTLGLGSVLYYDVMSLVTILATKTTLYQQNFLSPHKYLVITQQKYAVSAKI